MSKSIVVVATCRSGKELEEVEEKFSDALRDFERVELGDVSEEEARRVANEAGIEFKSFDGTIGSLFLGLKAMRIRFEREPEECKILFRVLKLLHDAQIFSPRKSLVEEIYRRKLEKDRISASMSVESALERLERDSFIFVLKLKEFQAIRERHESYLDFTEYSASVDDFHWLKGILVELKDAEGLFYLGNAFCYRGLFKSGIGCYDESLEQKPNAAAYYNRGNAYAKLNEYERAIKDYDKAIELNPNYAKAYGNRGIAYSEIQRYEEATRDLKKAGILFFHSGKEEDAVKAFSICFKLRDKIENDDIVYCGLALFLITLNPDVIIALRKMKTQDEMLRKLLELAMRKLRNEDISEEITVPEEKEKREEMKLLLELLKKF